MNNKTTPKDFFLHVGAIVTLYVSVGALISLAFEIANRLLPDQLSNYFSASSIIYPVSMLAVLVPALYAIEWLIARDIKIMPEKKDIWVRRWRIYLTLFLTGAAIAGDFIALISVYLNGEISSRFIWKILIVLFVSSAVFKYYFFSMNASMRWAKFVKKTMPWWGIILVLAAIISGFVIVGSPVKQRAIRFDQQRVREISNAVYSVAHYWQEFGKVPDSLSDLPEYGTMNLIPKDPVTGIPYIYEKGLQNNSFKICATFAEPSINTDSNYSKSINVFYNWDHPAGEYCFDRTVSPVDFPPVSNANQSIPKMVAPKQLQ